MLFCREICFVEIYALLRGEILSQKLYPWRKNDKYEVWIKNSHARATLPSPPCHLHQSRSLSGHILLDLVSAEFPPVIITIVIVITVIVIFINVIVTVIISLDLVPIGFPPVIIKIMMMIMILKRKSMMTVRAWS